MPTPRATPLLLALLLPGACDDPADDTTATTTTTTTGDPSSCPDYLQFCVTAELTGSVTAERTAATNFGQLACAAWAAGGPARILELPFIVDPGLTVALTRIGKYTGPGTYTLAPVTMTGDPDSFPAINADGRAFTNGPGTTATVTVAADGSGTLAAAGLIETESVQGPTPDPDARVDLAYRWTCNPAVNG
ncbi:MAG: hypothetical protein JNK56_20650 [Myxococcales bacterium]|nr:hypothetical protein [Myxococcales bacterium]